VEFFKIYPYKLRRHIVELHVNPCLDFFILTLFDFILFIIIADATVTRSRN
jgi:hypothetical protein